MPDACAGKESNAPWAGAGSGWRKRGLAGGLAGCWTGLLSRISSNSWLCASPPFASGPAVKGMLPLGSRAGLRCCGASGGRGPAASCCERPLPGEGVWCCLQCQCHAVCTHCRACYVVETARKGYEKACHSLCRRAGCCAGALCFQPSFECCQPRGHSRGRLRRRCCLRCLRAPRWWCLCSPGNLLLLLLFVAIIQASCLLKCRLIIVERYVPPAVSAQPHHLEVAPSVQLHFAPCRHAQCFGLTNVSN